MAIGTTGTFDPATGERRETQFEYTPVNPQDEMIRQAFERSQQAFYPPPPQPQGPTPYWENPATYYPRQEQPDPVAQAKAATAAAYKYIAFRGYQQDLKEGKSAADAFAKWGPMLVQDVSFAPAMKALTPTPQPTWMPANAATGQPGTWVSGGKVTVPTQQGPSRFVPFNPETGEPAHYEIGGKIEQLRNVAQGISPTAALNAVVDPMKWAFAQEVLGPESTNLVNIAKGGMRPTATKPAAPVTVETAAAQPTPQSFPAVTSKAEFDKLPSGAVYLNKGKLYRKP